MKFAELEKELGDLERARAIFELAITQPLDMPEVVWKAYIDFEYEEEEWDRTRALYKRLLERTSHVKVWISWAQFESNAGKTIARAYRDQDEDEEEDGDEQAQPQEKVVSPEAEEAAQQAEKDGLAAARKVFEDGYKDLKARALKQERLILLEAWKALETADGDAESLSKVEAMMPRVVKKRRAISGDGSQQEEYFDMMFPVSLQVSELPVIPYSDTLLPLGRRNCNTGCIKIAGDGSSMGSQTSSRNFEWLELVESCIQRPHLLVYITVVTWPCRFFVPKLIAADQIGCQFNPPVLAGHLQVRLC